MRRAGFFFVKECEARFVRLPQVAADYLPLIATVGRNCVTRRDQQAPQDAPRIFTHNSLAGAAHSVSRARGAQTH